MFNKNVLITSILTSNYAVLRNFTEDKHRLLTNETKDVVTNSLKEMRKELADEVRFALSTVRVCNDEVPINSEDGGDPSYITETKYHTQEISIPDVIDPFQYLDEVPSEDYERLTSIMEDAFNGKESFGKNSAAMSRVGAMRKLKAYNTKCDELFTIRDVAEQIASLYPIVIPAEELETRNLEEEQTLVLKAVNRLVIAMCTPAGPIRTELMELTVDEVL